MKTYLIDFKKLVLLLLPHALRKKIIFAFLKASVAQLTILRDSLLKSRNYNLRSLHVTPQVCYLKAYLNECFGCSSNNGFEICDTIIEGNYLLTYDEDGFRATEIPIIIDNGDKRIYDDDVINRVNDGFTVICPSVISEPDKTIVKTIVNKYRLASRLATIQ